MNSYQIKRKALTALCIFAIAGASAGADDDGEFPINISALEKLAKNVTEVNLNSTLLKSAASFFTDKNANEAEIKKLIGGLKGLYVRSLEFDSIGIYSEKDIDPIRRLVSSPPWERMVGIKNKQEKEKTEIFTRVENSQIAGLAILNLEPTEVTIVLILGAIDLEKLRKLEGQFGIPKMDLGEYGKDRK